MSNNLTLVKMIIKITAIIEGYVSLLYYVIPFEPFFFNEYRCNHDCNIGLSNVFQSLCMIRTIRFSSCSFLLYLHKPSDKKFIETLDKYKMTLLLVTFYERQRRLK